MKHCRKLIPVVILALALVGMAATWAPSVGETSTEVAHGTVPPPPIPSDSLAA